MTVCDLSEQTVRLALHLKVIRVPSIGLRRANTDFARHISSSPHIAMAQQIDFAALRRDREDRQGIKRERSISPPASRKTPKLEATTIKLPSGAQLRSFTSTVQQDQESRKSAVANQASEKLKAKKSGTEPISEVASSTSGRSPGDIIYPHGIVKKTWAFGHDRNDHDIKLEEVLEPQSLRTAVLSAFQWDMDWVLSKLKVPPQGGSTKCVFIMQAKEEHFKTQLREESQSMRAWLRLCFPPMDGQTSCMHSKLMLLFHQSKLRIGVPTANLVNFDWGETGVMENSIFMIDLPRLPDGTQTDRKSLTEFGKELIYFLDKQGLDKDVREGVLKFDFAATSHMAFVHSIGGISAGDDAHRSGLASLSRAVRHMNLQSDDVEVDFAASSIGKLQDSQLSLLHAAACGEDVFAFTSKAASRQAANFFKQKSPTDHSIRDKFRIYFPTQETVQTSKAGAAGSICLSRDWYEDTTFPRRCFRDYISTRPGLLSHNKIMYVRPKDLEKTAWVYVGSANVSQSAWGKLVQNKRERTWHVNCKNWECGVLLAAGSNVAARDVSDTVSDGTTVTESSADTSDSSTITPTSNDELPPVSTDELPPASDDELPPADKDMISTRGRDLSTFDTVVKAPFLYPGPVYDGRDPWYFKEPH